MYRISLNFAMKIITLPALSKLFLQQFIGEHLLERYQDFLQESLSFLSIREFEAMVIEARETCIACRFSVISPQTKKIVIEYAAFSSYPTKMPSAPKMLGLPFYILEIFKLKLNYRAGRIAFDSYQNTNRAICS